jgi:3-oxoacyl-[acyl-carrier protein] reductase
MSDRYTSFANTGPGRALVRRLGLPNPPRLRRHRRGDPLTDGAVMVGGDGRLAGPVRKVLSAAGVVLSPEVPSTVRPSAPVDLEPLGGLVYDATSLREPAALRDLYDFFHPLARSLAVGGRVIVFGTPLKACSSPAEAAAQQALEGFVRSVGKEFGRGITAQLVLVTPEAESLVESTLRFLLSARSAYVSGQVIHIGPGQSATPDDWERPLAGKIALVTGAARGIGEAIARVLVRDGAHVVCLDVPAAGDALAAVANSLRGEALQVDLTASHAPRAIADHLSVRHGGVDIVVHNAGILRDRTLARMSTQDWDSVLDVNLGVQERVNTLLLKEKLIRSGGRVVAVSSLSGIAGNRGQTNYATSKAGVIGLTRALASVVAEEGLTANAVAPGFIETKMTATMPMMLREAGRRMNSLSQGGLPVDVAETVAWLASPGSGGINGNVIRVCGQSLLGA